MWLLLFIMLSGFIFGGSVLSKRGTVHKIGSLVHYVPLFIPLKS